AKEAKATQKALADYLDSKLPPLTPKQTGKPPANHKEADRWLKDEIVWGDGTKYKLDDKDINWWHSLAPGGYADGGPSLPAFGMVRLLADSYVDCGDPKYAAAILKYVRSFYHKARPLAKADWGDKQFQGP